MSLSLILFFHSCILLVCRSVNWMGQKTTYFNVHIFVWFFFLVLWKCKWCLGEQWICCTGSGIPCFLMHLAQLSQLFQTSQIMAQHLSIPSPHAEALSRTVPAPRAGDPLLKWFEVEQNAFVLRRAEGF